MGIALLVTSFAAVAGLREGAMEAIGWFARTENFQSQVSESLPLLVVDGRLSAYWAVRYLSGFVLLFPLAFVAALVAAWRGGEQRASRLLFLWFAAGLFVAALAQRRFANSFSLPMVVLMGWGCCSAYRAVLFRMAGKPAARAIAMVAACSLAAVLLQPSVLFYGRVVRYELALRSGARGAVPAQVQHERRMAEVALFLRDHTPPTAGWLDASTSPEYAVLGPWSIGHRIEYLARRPTVTNAFGDDIGRAGFRKAQRYFALSEAKAVELLKELRVRYVVAGREPPSHIGNPGPNSMFRALYFRDGVKGRGEGKRAPMYPSLEQHRLLYEAGPAIRTGPTGPSAFKVFEYVRGAVISGRAAPGGTVRVKLRMRSNRAREIVYSATAKAAEDGEYLLRVPYSTSGYPGLLKLQGLYSLECGDESIDVSIAENQVREGLTVRMPDICLDSLPASFPARR